MVIDPGKICNYFRGGYHYSPNKNIKFGLSNSTSLQVPLGAFRGVATSKNIFKYSSEIKRFVVSIALFNQRGKRSIIYVNDAMP